MSPVVECLAWVGGIWMVIAIAAAWVKHRNRPRPPLPQRTPADVWADVDITRTCRQLAQVIDDHDAVWDIWPDPPSARVIEAQHRHDTAKQQREEKGQ